MPPQQVITFIIGTIVILFGAYYVTYYIGRKASGQSRAGFRNRNIAVHDRFAISRDKSFCVVEIAGKIYIIGVTNNSMTLLDTYDADEFAELTAAGDGGSAMPWSDTPVGRYGNKLTKKMVAFIASKTGKLPKEDNIYAAGSTNETARTKEESKSSFKDSMKAAEHRDGAGTDEGSESEDD